MGFGVLGPALASRDEAAILLLVLAEVDIFITYLNDWVV